MLTCDLRFVEEELRVICDESGRFLVRKEGLLCQLDLLGGGGSSSGLKCKRRQRYKLQSGGVLWPRPHQEQPLHRLTERAHQKLLRVDEQDSPPAAAALHGPPSRGLRFKTPHVPLP